MSIPSVNMTHLSKTAVSPKYPQTSIIIEEPMSLTPISSGTGLAVSGLEAERTQKNSVTCRGTVTSLGERERCEKLRNFLGLEFSISIFHL